MLKIYFQEAFYFVHIIFGDREVKFKNTYSVIGYFIFQLFRFTYPQNIDKNENNINYIKETIKEQKYFHSRKQIETHFAEFVFLNKKDVENVFINAKVLCIK